MNDSTLYLIYRPKVGGTWVGAEEAVEQGQESVEFLLTGLMSGTEYEVRISFDSRLLGPGVEETSSSLNSESAKAVKGDNEGSVPKDPEFNQYTFQTLPPAVVGVAVDDVSHTGASVVVTVDEPNGTDVHIRYSTDRTFLAGSTDTASEPVLLASGEATVEFDLIGLSPGSTYYVEASFDSNFDSNVTESTSFTTDSLSITGVVVDVDSVTQVGASVKVTADVPSGTLVQLHHKKTADTAWSGPLETGVVWDSDTSAYVAEFVLDGLASATDYTVYGSFDATAPTGLVGSLPVAQKDSFTTDPPIIDRVEPNETSQTAAKMRVYISASNGVTDVAVNLRFRNTADPVDDWGSTQTGSTTGATVDFDLESLSAATTYLVQVSSDSNFGSGVKETTFTTDSPDPQVDGITFTDVGQTSATAEVSVANPGTGSLTAFLHYMIADETAWVPYPPLSGTVTDGTAVIDLVDLVSGTRYEVQASLDPKMKDGIQSKIFDTDPPSVEDIEFPTKGRPKRPRESP